MKRERHKEGGSSVFLRLEPYLPAMLLDQPTRDVEAQTSATDASPPGVVRAHEASEDKAMLVRGDAYSVIPYLDFRLFVICPARPIATSERDKDGTTIGAVLYGVGHEIGEHLLNTGSVY
ncbi:MAG TPA: hypothetical protein VJR06_00810, partial [Nitrososphaerales archaeon]|nr:hypothetical protein [Nitrososphaerales archaeon]